MLKYNVERNPIIYVNGVGIQTIGDPHLGREFRTNVNIERRGEREASVLQTFTTLLKPKDTTIKYIIIVGDLFDTYAVKSEVVLNAYEDVIYAANQHTEVEYIIIPGNHDLSKNRERSSSFEIFHRLLTVSELPNITVLLENHQIIEDLDNSLVLFCTAYDPFFNTEISTIEETKLKTLSEVNDIITIGHFDGFEINGKGYLPTPKMKELSDLIISGHEHTYKEIEDPICNILFTGSMQPYSHAEDPDNDLYVTIDYDVLKDIDVVTLKNKFVRILLDSETVFTERFECMSLTFKLKEQVIEEIDVVAELKTNTKDFDTLGYTEQLLLALEKVETTEELSKKYNMLLATKGYIK